MKIKKNPYYIAEIANSHNGNINLMYKSIDELNKTRVDAIKFQFFWISDLIDKDHKEYNIYKKITFSKKDWLKIFAYLKKNNKKHIYFDVFGLNSLNFLIKNFKEIYGFKLHTSDIYNVQLINKLSKLNKQIIISCGGVLVSEILDVINEISKHNKKPVILMNGFQSYPTRIKDLNLVSKLNYFKKYFKNHIIGYADHTDGEKIEKFIIPFIFFNYGVKVIEKHFTLDRSLKFEDYESSITKEEFQHFIKIGNGIFDLICNEKRHKKLSSKEMNYRNNVIKVVHTNKIIEKNSVIKKEDVQLLRPKKIFKNYFRKTRDVIGKITKKRYPKNEQIKKADLKI